MNAWAEILQLLDGELLTGFAIFVRIGAMLAILPVFGEQTVPMRVRLAVTLAFSAIVYPIVDMPDASVSNLHWINIPTEAAIGIFFGLLLRFFVLALQIAGSIAAQSTSLSQIFGGSAGVDPQPAMGRTLVIAGLALAAMLGLHVQIAKYIIGSYTMFPFGAIMTKTVVIDVGITAVSNCFALGFTLAGPFVIASLLYNVTLGVINKAMPQLMVSFVGAPAITAGGLFLLFLAAPIMLQMWSNALDVFFVAPDQVPR